MKMRDFELEVFFGKHEFTAPYLLTQSDCEAMTVEELLAYEPGAAQALQSCWLGYTEVPGAPALRQLAASLYQNIAPGEILMHTGAQEAVFSFMNVVLEEGDHVITMFPIYQSLHEVALSVGCDVSRWQLRPQQGRWTLDFDELESLIRPSTKLISLNTPNNPTGYTLTEEEIKKLCAIAEKHGLYVFADEVYRGLDLDGQARPWVADVYDKAVSLGVLSKSYGLAGLRIGWVATRDRTLLEKMTRFKHYLSICNSGPSEVLAAIAFRHSEQLLQRSLHTIRENLTLADAFFARHPGLFTPYRPQCGPVAFHKMAVEESLDTFCDRLVERAGVLLLPASVYEYDGPFFRMGYGRRSFAGALSKFEEYLLAYGYA